MNQYFFITVTYSVSILGTLGRIPENEEHVPNSPPGKLTVGKLERHNQSYGVPSTGRRTTAGKSESSVTNKSGKCIYDYLSFNRRSYQFSLSLVAESVISRATARKGKF